MTTVQKVSDSANINRLKKIFTISVAQMCDFNIVSDLHRELVQRPNAKRPYKFPMTAPYLILAGDLHLLKEGYEAYKTLIVDAAKSYTEVFWVAGNHCLYDDTVDNGYSRAREIASRLANVHFMQQDRFDFPDQPLTILGCTLFSYIPPKAAAVVASQLLDFQRTVDWDIPKYNAAHVKECVWLREAILNVPCDRRIILVTHHAPAGRGVSDPVYEFAGRLISHAFQTELSAVIGMAVWRRLGAAVYGHTHYSVDHDHFGVRLVSNQVGYRGENTGYEAKKTYTM